MASVISPNARRFFQLAARLRRLTPPNGDPTTEVSPSHLAMLTFVSNTPGCSLHDIAQGLNLSAPTVSIAVRQLENLGWLQRRPHPHDRRALQISLTPQGEQAYQQALHVHCQKFELLLQGLTPSEQDTLLNLLSRALQTAETSSPSRRE